MASGPITSWQIHGETMEREKDFIFFGRKAMTNLDRVLKSRDLTLSAKVHTVVWFCQWSCMDVRAGPETRLSTEELMLSNCGAGEDS